MIIDILLLRNLLVSYAKSTPFKLYILKSVRTIEYRQIFMGKFSNALIGLENDIMSSLIFSDNMTKIRESSLSKEWTVIS